MAGHDPPASGGIARDLQVDPAHVLALAARHDRGHARQKARIGIHARHRAFARPARLGAREDAMLVAHHDGIDPAVPGQPKRPARLRRGPVAQTVVAQRHHQVGAPRPQPRHPQGRHLRHLAQGQVGHVGVSLRGLGQQRAGQEGQYADPHHVAGAGPVRQLAGQQRRLLRQRGARCRIAHGIEVRGQHREPRRAQRRPQRGRAEIEIVIAQRDRVEIERVHRGDHRMRLDLRRGRVRIGPTHRIRQLRAEQEIARIEEQAVGGLAPELCDKLGGGLQPPARLRAARGVVEGAHVAMQIAGGQQPQRHNAPVFFGRRGRTIRCDHGRPRVPRIHSRQSLWRMFQHSTLG
nr:hypothetical protein [Palleronia pontilimi]